MRPIQARKDFDKDGLGDVCDPDVSMNEIWVKQGTYGISSTIVVS
jgi:hypothetical protein